MGQDVRGKLTRFTAVSVGPGVVLAIGYVVLAIVNSHVLQRCDATFGCDGAVGMYTILSGLAAIVSSLGCGLAAALYTKAVYSLPAKALTFAIAINAVFLLVISATLTRWIYDALLGVFFAWMTLSALGCWGALLVVRDMDRFRKAEI